MFTRYTLSFILLFIPLLYYPIYFDRLLGMYNICLFIHVLLCFVSTFSSGPNYWWDLWRIETCEFKWLIIWFDLIWKYLNSQMIWTDLVWNYLKSQMIWFDSICEKMHDWETVYFPIFDILICLLINNPFQQWKQFCEVVVIPEKNPVQTPYKFENFY